MASVKIYKNGQTNKMQILANNVSCTSVPTITNNTFTAGMLHHIH